MPIIATLRRFPATLTERIGQFGDVHAPVSAVPLTGETAIEHVRGADALFVSALDPVTADMIDAALNLKAISSIGVGLDHIDLEACHRRGIRVANTPNSPTEPTADLAFALMLGAARRLPAADAFVRAGDWPANAGAVWGLDVHGRTIGIVGMGRIGRAIARRAAGFGMMILYTDRIALDANALEGLTASNVSLDELLKLSDFVVLQAPLTTDTYHLIGPDQLAIMKPTAVLVNSGRGGLVDENALVDALEAKRLAHAALDVFENEPDINPRLLNCPNLILAPHIGTATHATRGAMVDEALANLGNLMGA